MLCFQFTYKTLRALCSLFLFPGIIIFLQYVHHLKIFKILIMRRTCLLLMRRFCSAKPPTPNPPPPPQPPTANPSIRSTQQLWRALQALLLETNLKNITGQSPPTSTLLNPLFSFHPRNKDFWRINLKYLQITLWPILVFSTIVWQKFGFWWSVPCWLFSMYWVGKATKYEQVGKTVLRVRVLPDAVIEFEHVNTEVFRVKVSDLLCAIDGVDLKNQALQVGYVSRSNKEYNGKIFVKLNNCVATNPQIMYNLLAGELAEEELKKLQIKERTIEEARLFNQLVAKRIIEIEEGRFIDPLKQQSEGNKENSTTETQAKEEDPQQIKKSASSSAQKEYSKKTQNKQESPKFKTKK